MSSVCVITRAVLKEHTEPVLTSFYLEKDKLTEVHPHLEGRSLLGNIYVGKVKHVVKNIDAAFVEIAGGQTCYLPFKEAQAPVLTNRRWDGRLLAGDEILVQVMRDALKTKEPALTAKISLEGRLAAVVLDGGHGVRYSKQLPKETADHFREVLQSVTVPDGMTLVVRTAAGDAADTALLREANALFEKAQKLLSVGRSRTVFSMISEERPGWLMELLSHKQLPDKIVTDETLVYTALEDLYGSGASGIEKNYPPLQRIPWSGSAKELRSCREARNVRKFRSTETADRTCLHSMGLRGSWKKRC